MLCVSFLLLAAGVQSQEAPADSVPSGESEMDPAGSAAVPVFDPRSPFSIYKSNYLIYGSSDDQVKAQFGFKYEMFRNSGIFLAYRQIMFWNYYDKSSPITEIDLMPELFWNYGTDVDFLRVGVYEHKSNGQDGLTSRAWDRSYVQYRYSTGDFFNMGVDIKAFYIWQTGVENPDIDDYLGYYEAEIFFRFLKSGPGRLTDKEELYIRGGTGRANFGFDFSKGWVEAGLKFRMVLTSIMPHFYIQFFYGYGETMIGYNEKDWSIRGGLVLD